MSTPMKGLLRQVLTKELLIDLEDGLRAEALKAHSIVRDHTSLDKKRARESEGQLRFRMMEQRFEAICQMHGGRLLDGGVIPQTNLKVFQPFLRFQFEQQGIIFGLAALPEPKTVPVKNKSRAAGVRLNYYLTPRLAFDVASPQQGDIFVLLLVSRDRERAGQIEEVAVGIIDSKYESLLFYEALDEFLSGHADEPVAPPQPPAPETRVKLKKQVTPFVPPEAPDVEGDKETGTK